MRRELSSRAGMTGVAGLWAAPRAGAGPSPGRLPPRTPRRQLRNAPPLAWAPGRPPRDTTVPSPRRVARPGSGAWTGGEPQSPGGTAPGRQRPGDVAVPSPRRVVVAAEPGRRANGGAVPRSRRTAIPGAGGGAVEPDAAPAVASRLRAGRRTAGR